MTGYFVRVTLVITVITLFMGCSDCCSEVGTGVGGFGAAVSINIGRGAGRYCYDMRDTVLLKWVSKVLK